MKKRALISVYNKDGILELAEYLFKENWEILSTGGTAKYLTENGIRVTDISAVTGFPECLDGRVKTLHPAVHAGILARRDIPSHINTLKEQGIGRIDLVCVNLYPFFEKVQSGLSLEETIEFIDIGGPSMLRSAAKNFRDVFVLTDPKDYKKVIEIMSHELGTSNKEQGAISNEQISAFRRMLAGKVFNLTSAYDAAIAQYLLDIKNNNNLLPVTCYLPPVEDEYPEYLSLSMQKGQHLRYGENPHQKAALYLNTDKTGVFSSFLQLHGKELGYNNIRDLDIAWKIACAFGLKNDNTNPFGYDDVNELLKDAASDLNAVRVCCVAVKHNTPCGAALGKTLLDAYNKVFACDPVSIFGGIIACNTKVDESCAYKLSELFLEIVAAPDFDDKALEILKKKKNLRIIKIQKAPKENYEYISLDGGMLVQQRDIKLMEKWEVVTKTLPDKKYIADMIFGMRAVSFVKSNAIMIVKDLAALGIGGGQVNRIWPAVQALQRSRQVIKTAKDTGFDAGGSPWEDDNPAPVMASDAFFPFSDIVEAAAEYGIKAIIQPGGSVNDKLSIEACDKHGIAMVFTGTRHFKH